MLPFLLCTLLRLHGFSSSWFVLSEKKFFTQKKILTLFSHLIYFSNHINWQKWRANFERGKVRTRFCWHVFCSYGIVLWPTKWLFGFEQTDIKWGPLGLLGRPILSLAPNGRNHLWMRLFLFSKLWISLTKVSSNLIQIFKLKYKI